MLPHFTALSLSAVALLVLLARLLRRLARHALRDRPSAPTTAKCPFQAFMQEYEQKQKARRQASRFVVSAVPTQSTLEGELYADKRRKQRSSAHRAHV